MCLRRLDLPGFRRRDDGNGANKLWRLNAHTCRRLEILVGYLDRISLNVPGHLNMGIHRTRKLLSTPGLHMRVILVTSLPLTKTDPKCRHEDCSTHEAGKVYTSTISFRTVRPRADSHVPCDFKSSFQLRDLAFLFHRGGRERQVW